jgi:hypothetical protein
LIIPVFQIALSPGRQAPDSKRILSSTGYFAMESALIEEGLAIEQLDDTLFRSVK